MSRPESSKLGYLLSEETYQEVMQGLESLRFLEGLACMAASSNLSHAPQFDIDDLAGFIQLLLSHTYKPLKALEYQHWQLIPRGTAATTSQPAHPVRQDPEEDEQALLRNYRTLQEDERKALLCIVDAIAGKATAAC